VGVILEGRKTKQKIKRKGAKVEQDIRPKLEPHPDSTHGEEDADIPWNEALSL